MDISYKRELNHSYLILKNENQQALSDYPAKMLFSNSIKGLLPCIPRLIDGETSLYYEITSRQSLSQIYETKKFNSNDLKALFEALLNTITCMEDYLLDADLLLLSPDYIYQDFESSFYFCCFPLEPASSDKDFISLPAYIRAGKAGRTSGVFIQGVQGHKRIEETVYRLESIFKRKRRLI